MGYRRRLSINELKKKVTKCVDEYNLLSKTNFKVVDIYKVPNLECKWNRIIAKITDDKNEKIISIRYFSRLWIPGGVEIINYSDDVVYEIPFVYNPTLTQMPLDEYLKKQSSSAEEFVEEINDLRANIKANNIKKRIARSPSRS